MASPRYLTPNNSTIQQRTSDENFFSNVDYVMAKFLNSVKEIYVPETFSEAQFNLLCEHLRIGKNYFVFPHVMFCEVYAEPNGVALVNYFLTLLMNLPAELRILQATTRNYFGYRLENIFGTTIADKLSTLTPERISKVMAGDARFQFLPARQQKLFIDILVEQRKNNFENTVTENLVTQLTPGMIFLTADNVEATLDVSYVHLVEIVAELDRQLSEKKEEFFMLMLRYFLRFTTSMPNLQTIEFIFQEFDSKSPLNFFNKQLDFSFTPGKLNDYINRYYASFLKANHPLEPFDANFFRFYMLVKFYAKYPETQLTKMSSVKVTQELLVEIATAKKYYMNEKLIQFEVVFALAEIFVNKHANPRLDRGFRIANTHTWQVLMTEIRNAAFAQLTDRSNYPNPLQIIHYLPTLRAALAMPLFNRHRHNYHYIFSRRDTTAVVNIKTIVNSLQRPLNLLLNTSR